MNKEINVQINFIKSYGILPDGLTKHNQLKINTIKTNPNNNSNSQYRLPDI
jgi:hypothetical protein